MYNRKFAFTVVLIIVINFSCFAQTKTIVGLKQAIDTALYNYPGLKAKQFQVASAEASLNDSKHQRLPTFKISGQVDLGPDNSLDGSYCPMGIIPSTSGGIRPDNNTNLFSGNIGVAYLEHELYNFGLNGARIESSKSLVHYSKADYAETSYLLQFHIAQLYFDLLRYRLLTGIQQKNIERFQVLYNYIKAYSSSGIKAGVDSSIANAEVSKAKIEYIQTLETYNKLKREFVYYTGIKTNNFEIDTTLYYLPGVLINQLKENVSVDSVSNSNPVMAYYNSRWEYALSQEKLIKKSYLPKIYLVGSAWERGSSISSKDMYGNLSTGLDYKAAIQYYQSESMREEVQQQKSLLENQLQQADIAIQAAIDREKEIPLQLKAAQDAFFQKSAQYNAGLANITELTDASYLLYKAETDEVESLSDLLNTLLQKAVTNNTLNSFLNSF